MANKVLKAGTNSVLATGEVIESYPNAFPHPARLAFGFVGTRPLQVVVAEDAAGERAKIVTVYEPDPLEWEPDFWLRRRP